MPWRIELLGGLRARQGERVVTRFSTHKTSSLLAYVTYHQKRAHPREELAALFWPEAAPEVGRHNLRQALLSLRRQLESPAASGSGAGPFLVHRTEVRVSPAVSTDVAEFEAEWKRADPAAGAAEQVAALERAVELYEGDLLSGHYDEWILVERQRLAEVCLSALRRLTQLCEAAGDLDRAIFHGRRVIAMDPLREAPHRDLMRLLIAAGRPADALRQFHDLERVLRAELNAPPSEATLALARSLAGQSGMRNTPRTAPSSARATLAVPLAPSASRRSPDLAAPPPSPSTRPPAPRLPVPPTRFFGREEELEQLQALLRDPETRLITLTGAGGSGKTRLAIEVARRVLPGPADPLPAGGSGGSPLAGSRGIWFVPLADRIDARSLPDAIADAISLRDAGDGEPLERVVAFLNRRGAGLLLILDNFEHLLEAGAGVIGRLLERVPTLTCLVTSRQRLEIAGEHEFVVPPLPVPVESSELRVESGTGPAIAGLSTLNPQLSTLLDCPSVQLFVDRARAARPDFAVTPRNAAAVALLCRRLEGIPLALELAGARAQMLTPPQMVAQLERRFDFLVSRRRDVAPRHRTLRAAVGWSYELLPADLRHFFAQLSVFHGRWTLEAAHHILDFGFWILDCRQTQSPGVPDAFAGPIQNPKSEIQNQTVLEYLTELRERSLILIAGGEEAMEYRMLETLREYAAELLAPEERAILRGRHAAYYLWLAESAWRHLHGPEQGAWLDRLEAEHDNFRAALAWCLSSGVQALGRSGVQDRQRTSTSTTTTPERLMPVEIGLRLGGALHFFWQVRAHVSEGRRWLGELLALPAGKEPTAARAAALYGAAALAAAQGDFSTARPMYEECLAIRRARGDRQGMADALCQSGHVAAYVGEAERAAALYAESRTLYQELNDRGGLAHALKCIGAARLARGEAEQAQSLFEQSLCLYRELGNTRGIAMVLGEMGQMALLHGENERAAAMLEEHLALSRQLKDVAHTALALRNLGYAVRNQGNRTRARALFEESLTLRQELGDQAASAEMLAHLGVLARWEGQHEAAHACFGRGLALLRAMAGHPTAAACLELWVGSLLSPESSITLDAATARRVIRLLAAAETIRGAAGAGGPWPAERALCDRVIAGARASLGEAAFRAAWSEGRAMAFDAVFDEAHRLQVRSEE